MDTETKLGASRVLMLLENDLYPQDARVRREAQSLINAGFQVTIISPREKGQTRKEVIDHVTVYRYDAPPSFGGFLGYVVEYFYALLAITWLSMVVAFKEGFDVIHAHNPPDILVLTALIYRVFGKKFVFDHHDLSPELYRARSEDGGNRFVYRSLLFFERLAFRFADHVVSTNESYRTIAYVRGKVPEQKVTIVRNGPEADRLEAVLPDPDMNEDIIYIGYIGAMGLQDGLDYYMRALHCLVHEFGRSDFQTILIGNGDEVAKLKKMIAKLELQEHVRFTGYQPESVWRPMIAGTDICVVPDPSNPFNDRSTMMKFTDYMALGKPIVAFDLPENRVTAGDAALYAKPNSEYEFAKHIATLMDDAELCERMGQIGRRRVEESLAWEHQAKKLVEAYQVLTAPNNHRRH